LSKSSHFKFWVIKCRKNKKKLWKLASSAAVAVSPLAVACFYHIYQPTAFLPHTSCGSFFICDRRVLVWMLHVHLCAEERKPNDDAQRMMWWIVNQPKSWSYWSWDIGDEKSITLSHFIKRLLRIYYEVSCTWLQGPIIAFIVNFKFFKFSLLFPWFCRKGS